MINIVTKAIVISMASILTMGSSSINNNQMVNEDLLTSSKVMPKFYSSPKLSSEIMNKFKDYSPTYKKISIQVNLNALNYDKYDAVLTNLQEQIDVTQDNITASELQKEEYEADGNLIGVLNAQAMIDKYNLQIDDLNKSYAENSLQKDLYDYYKNNAEEVIDEQQRLAEFDFYKSYTSIAVYESQIEYYQTYLDELNASMKIEEAKLNTGYSTKLSVDSINNQIASTQAEYDTINSELENIKKTISASCGDYIISNIGLPNGMSIQSEDNYLDDFFKYNNTCDLLESQKSAYENYIDNLSELTDDSIGEQNAELQIEVIELNIEQYEMNIPLYVSQLVNKYKNLASQLKAKEQEITTANEKIKTASLLYEKGKVQKLEITKLETELSKLEYEKQVYCTIRI